MRFQKLVTFFLLAGSTLSVALAQTASESDPLVEALRRKQMELDAQEAQGVRPGNPPPPTQKPTRPAAVAKPKMDVVPPVQPPVVAKPAVVMPPAARSADEDQLVEALRRKQSQLDGSQGVRSAPAVAGGQEETSRKIRQIEADIRAKDAALKKTAATKPSKTAQALNTAPIYDLNTKEGKLAELLVRYKADEITPHEYHLQRAKIIAGQ